MAKREVRYRIVSQDDSKAGVDSATSRLEQFNKSMSGITRSMEGMNKLAALAMGAGAIGGLTMIFTKVSAAVADCEKQFLALHPEMSRAVGSSRDMDAAVNSMKASIGGAISSVLRPFRQYFIDLVDPTANATQNLKEFRQEYDQLIAKFASAERKAIDDYNQRLGEQAKTEKELADALVKRIQLTTLLADQQARLKQLQGYGPTAASAVQTLQGQISTTQSTQSMNEETIAKLQDLLQVEKDWFKANPKPGTGGGAGGRGGGGGTVSDPNILGALLSGLSYFNSYAEMQTTAMDNLTTAVEKNTTWKNRYANDKGTGAEGPTYGRVAGPDVMKPGDYMADTAPTSGGLDLSGIMDPLKAFGMQIASVAALMQPLQTILNGVLSVLAPILNTALQPLVGILVVLGETIGALLVPVVEALAPVIEAIGKGFIRMYNDIILPVANGLYAAFSWIGQGLRNLGMIIKNIVTGNWGNLMAGTTNTSLAELYAGGPLKTIDMSTLMNAGATVTQGSQAAGASYTAQRDITVSVGMIQVNTDVITGEGGFRDLVLKIDQELEQCIALGLAAG